MKKYLNTSCRTLLTLAAVLAVNSLAQADEYQGSTTEPSVAEQRDRAQADTGFLHRVEVSLQHYKASAAALTEQGAELYRNAKFEEAINKFALSNRELAQITHNNTTPTTEVMNMVELNQKYIAMSYRAWAESIIGALDGFSASKQGDVAQAQTAIEYLRRAREIYPPCAPEVEKDLAYYNRVLETEEIRTDLRVEKLAPTYSAEQQNVARSMAMAKQYYNLKDYENARIMLLRVLKAEPTNMEASNYMRLVNQALLKVAYERYTYERIFDVVEVSGGQIRPRSQFDVTTTDERVAQSAVEEKVIVKKTPGVVALENKLKGTYIDETLEFDGVPLADVVNILRRRSIEEDPNGVGVNFVLLLAADDTGASGEGENEDEYSDGESDGEEDPEDFGGGVMINQDIPPGSLAQVISAILSSHVDLDSRIDENAVVLYSKRRSVGNLTLGVFFPENGIEGDDAVQWLIDNGIPFPEASSKSSYLKQPRAYFDASSGASGDEQGRPTLFVMAPEQINEQIAELINELNTPKPLVLIESRFVEVAQSDLHELGFDWMLSRTPPAGKTSSIPFRFGTAGSYGVATNYDYLSRTTQTPMSPMYSLNGIDDPTQEQELNNAGKDLNPNALRDLQFMNQGGTVLDATSPFSDDANAVAYEDQAITWRRTADRTTGSATDPSVKNGWGSDWAHGVDFQVTMRALSNATSSDVLATPRIIASEGEQTFIFMGTIHVWPTDYERPEVTTVSTDDGQSVGIIGASPIMGEVPDYETLDPFSDDIAKIGVKLSIDNLSVSVEDQIIEMDIHPTITSLTGWSEYLLTFTNPNNGDEFTQTLVFPIIEKRSIEAAVSVRSGETVLLGGIMRDKTYTHRDQIPILGSIPVVGRLFRTDAKKVEATNLLIFLTCRLVDATGKPLDKTAAPVQRGMIPIDY